MRASTSTTIFSRFWVTAKRVTVVPSPRRKPCLLRRAVKQSLTHLPRVEAAAMADAHRHRAKTMMIQNDVPITPDLVREHGLKDDEYRRFVDLIGREPTLTELGIVSAMWNEHCSYKSSRLHLRTLPT